MALPVLLAAKADRAASGLLVRDALDEFLWLCFSKICLLMLGSFSSVATTAWRVALRKTFPLVVSDSSVVARLGRCLD